LAFEALKGPIKNTRVGGHGESTIYGGSAQSMGSDNLLPRSLILAKHSFLATFFNFKINGLLDRSLMEIAKCFREGNYQVLEVATGVLWLLKNSPLSKHGV
jgi:hypothetical protein